jgi:hypothetical protein
MGYTGNTTKIVKAIIANYSIGSVLDLGSQQNYDQPNLPAPYISQWYHDLFGFRKNFPERPYYSIDTNGENDSYPLDLGQPLPDDFIVYTNTLTDGEPFEFSRKVDLLVDAGTSEHVGKDQAFDWQAIYNCWLNKHNLLKDGGIMVNENPKSGNWPGHGFNYYTKDFYRALEAATDYHIMLLDEHPAMENRVDGWNIVCVMQKTSERFPTLEEFKELGIQTS